MRSGEKMSFLSRLFAGAKAPAVFPVAPSMEEISRVVAEELAEERKAQFPKLNEGFTFKGSGRAGCIYFKEAGRLIEFNWEMSGVPRYDVLLWPEEVKEWIYPERVPIPEDKQRAILLALKAWLRKEGIKSDLEAPDRGPLI